MTGGGDDGITDLEAERAKRRRGRQTPAAGQSAGACKRTLTQRDQLIELAAPADLWHDGDVAYASCVVAGHIEHHALRTRPFRNWASYRFYALTKGAPGHQALEEAVSTLEAVAFNERPQHPAFVRVGATADAVYLDLADPDWRAVEISADGWRVVERPPVRFLRREGMLPLPPPQPEGSLEALRPFVHMSDGDFELAAGGLVASLRPCGPYPILNVVGEPGSGKSTLVRQLRSLIDPNVAAVRSPPREERDLYVAARNSYFVAFDNLSHMPEWLGDGLCRISTGLGYGARRLHTGLDEDVFAVSRPVLLNGIGDVATRADLASRCLTVTLQPISDRERRRESEIIAAFEAERPFLIGALCDAVAAAWRDYENVELPALPRLADAAAWIVAAEQAGALPWSPGNFLAAFTGNRKEQAQTIVDNDPVARGVRELAAAVANRSADPPDGSRPGWWHGTASGLLDALRARLGERTTGSRSFPQAPNALSGRLRRLAADLRRVGVDVEIGKDSTRFISFRVSPPDQGPAS